MEQWFLHIIKKEKSILHPLLSIFSQCYRFGVFLRNTLFDKGLLPIYTAKKKVISVGNIVAGGSGKTPFVAYIAKEIGKPVAIITRGYRGVKHKKEPFVVTSPEEGDEAFWLQEKLPFATVIIAKSRRAGAKLAETLPVDYILLDDGMQHRYLHRDIDIAMIHKEDLFSKQAFLPRGLLRDSLERLQKADYIVVQGIEREEELAETRKKIPQKQLIITQYKPLNGEAFKGKKVGAFCGIAKPKTFFSLLEDLGATIVEKKLLPDHRPLQDIRAFRKQATKKGADLVVCTEKDFIKLKEKTGIYPICLEMKVLVGEEHIQLFKNIVE